MAAADSDQSAYEYPMPGCDPTEGPCKVGRFSFHLARALAEVDPDVSYAELLSNVRSQIMASSGSRPNQHPQLHGQSHRPLFGTGYVKRPVMSFAVQPVKDVDDPVTIAAGLIHGLKRDQTVALYATDAAAVAGEEPLGHVVIDRLKASSAEALFIEDADPAAQFIGQCGTSQSCAEACGGDDVVPTGVANPR